MSDEENINVTEENFTVGAIAKWDFILVQPVGNRTFLTTNINR
jgi:hypothetical protein